MNQDPTVYLNYAKFTPPFTSGTTSSMRLKHALSDRISQYLAKDSHETQVIKKEIEAKNGNYFLLQISYETFPDLASVSGKQGHCSFLAVFKCLNNVTFPNSAGSPTKVLEQNCHTATPHRVRRK